MMRTSIPRRPTSRTKGATAWSPSPPSIVAALVALVALVALAGCSPAKREAASLVAAVDRFRMAENAAKPQAERAVEDAKCTDREVCDARDACLASARPTAKGLTLKAEVERGVDDLGAGRLSRDADDARALPAKLDEAARLLEEGHAKLPACDAKITALRLKYAL